MSFMAYGVTADGERRYLPTMRVVLSDKLMSMDLRDTDVRGFERIELAWQPDPPAAGEWWAEMAACGECGQLDVPLNPDGTLCPHDGCS